MALAAEVKTKVVTAYRRHENDSGSPEVQIALLTSRIQQLTEHFKMHKKDHASRRGLLKMVGARSAMLRYLNRTDRKGYQRVIESLGLRK